MSGLPRWLRPLLATLALSALCALLVSALVERVYEVPLTARSFRFERPLAASLTVAGLLVLIARGYLHKRRRPRLRMSHGHDLASLPEGPRVWLEPVLTGSRVCSVLLMALALMGPQSIHARDVTEVQGIDMVLTLDLSLSMQAADIRPNRFVATQAVVDEFILKRPNDRIGAVLFGRDAHTLLPLTTDHEALRGMIAELELGVIEGRGTAIGNGLGTALNRLRRSDAKSKVVILLTDGDSNSGNVSPLQAAEFAKALGVKVYTILMGRTDNAPVQSGLDLFGRAIFDRGNFPVNPELLKKVAAQTGGEAFQVADRAALERSFHTILDHLERSQIEDAGRVYGELFPAFLAPALVLLFLEILIAALWQREVAMTWHAADLLWALLAVPLLAAALFLGFRLRRKAALRFGTEPTLQRLVHGRPIGIRAARALLILLGLSCALIALARPQYGSRTRMLRKRGVDVVIALDFSKSMLARDVRPSRIERAKAEVTAFLNELGGDRVGIVAFAGETMEFPMTVDYGAAALFFRDLGPYDMPVGGTAIGRALTAAKRLLERSSRPESKDDPNPRSRMVVLLTDGEDHEGDPVAAAQELGKMGVRVYTVGIGTRTGEPIPTYTEDGTWTGYMRDEKGNSVLTSLSSDNETQLKKIAEATNGKYFAAGRGSVGMDQIRAEMRRMHQGELKARKITVHEERYAPVLLLAFLLVLAESLLPEAIFIRRKPAEPSA